jgi:hypothetical protein
MKRQKSCGPRLGKLVHQLPGVVTFAYDLRFRRVIARWKGIVEEINFGGSIMPSSIIEHLDLKKPSFRPSKWPRKLNLLKIVNCQNCQKTVLSQSKKVGGHRYPPGSNISGLEDPRVQDSISNSRRHKVPILRGREREGSSKEESVGRSSDRKIDPDLCRNTMKYRNTHKCRDAAEVKLHFINNK